MSRNFTMTSSSEGEGRLQVAPWLQGEVLLGPGDVFIGLGGGGGGGGAK